MSLPKEYFTLFGIPASFSPDLGHLKKQYYKLSRSHHPDYHTHLEKAKQDEILEQSGLINTAYKVLSDEYERTKYILQLYNILEDSANEPLSQSFLMEMMDINEGIFDLKMKFDQASYEKILSELDLLEKALQQQKEQLFSDFEVQPDNMATLLKIKDFYLKSKYLLRIRENLSTFAGL